MLPNYKTKLYKKYRNMIDRCENPNNDRYYRYGGRNITVDSVWRNDFNKFKEWAYANGYIENNDLSIERINNDGNYEPNNCRWIPLREQYYNKRETIRLPDGSSLLQKYNNNELDTNLPYSCISDRLRNGHDLEYALHKEYEYKDNYDINGLNLKEATEKYSNVNYKCVNNRIKKLGWSIEDALFTPKQANKHSRMKFIESEWDDDDWDSYFTDEEIEEMDNM